MEITELTSALLALEQAALSEGQVSPEIKRAYRDLTAVAATADAEALVQGSLVITYLKLRDLQEADEAAAKPTSAGVSAEVAAVLANVKADLYNKLGRYPVALFWAQSAKELASKHEQDDDVLGEAWANEGFALTGLHDFDQASRAFGQASLLLLPPEIRNSVLLHEAFILESEGKLDEALSRQEAIVDWVHSRCAICPELHTLQTAEAKAGHRSS